MAQTELTSVARTGTVTIPTPASRALPLFEPLGEKAWADGWDPEILYPRSAGVPEAPASPGMVFRTHAAGEPPTIWVLALHDAAALVVEYATVTPGHRIGRIRVELEPAGEQRSRARVTYDFRALSARGAAYVEGFTEEQYAARMARWEKAIGHYLATGRILPRHGD